MCRDVCIGYHPYLKYPFLVKLWEKTRPGPSMDIKPSQAKPSQAKPSQAKPRHSLFDRKYHIAQISGSCMQTWQYR